MSQLRVPVWRAAVMLVLLAPLFACQGSRELDAQSMARQLRALASVSAEGAVLISELRSGHLKPAFASVHIENLAEDANKAAREIAKPAPPALQRQHAAAQALAEQLSQTLRAVMVAQTGPDAQLEKGQQTFTHLKSGFDAIEKS